MHTLGNHNNISVSLNLSSRKLNVHTSFDSRGNFWIRTGHYCHFYSAFKHYTPGTMVNIWFLNIASTTGGIV